MTWTAKIMSDDQVDPTSLVGVMLQVGEEGEVTGDGSGDALPEIDQPLWHVLELAFLAGRSPGYCDRFGYANEIDALRNWLPRRPPKDFCNRLCAELQTYDVTMVGRTMDWLHELLTEQARIARGES